MPRSYDPPASPDPRTILMLKVHSKDGKVVYLTTHRENVTFMGIEYLSYPYGIHFSNGSVKLLIPDFIALFVKGSFVEKVEMAAVMDKGVEFSLVMPMDEVPFELRRADGKEI